MKSKISPRLLILIGIIFESVLFFTFFLLKDDLGEVFRYAARYSGRFSFVLYLLAFYWFIKEHTLNLPLIRTKKWVTVFSIMHLIHFGFLAASVELNDLPIVSIKVIGRFLAYIGILCYPFYRKHPRNAIPSDVLLLCWFRDGHDPFLARIRGEFVGANPEVVQFIGLGIVLIYFGMAWIRLYQIR